MTPNPDGPGLLFVNSKISSDQLSTELFNHWYSDEHVPDVLDVGVIPCAFRFYTAHPMPETVERPHLAIYSATKTSFLLTPAFDVPVHSDKLPGPSRCIFDFAQFDVRTYLTLGKREQANCEPGPTGFIATVQFEPPAEVTSLSPEDLVKWYTQQDETSPKRTRLFQLNTSTLNNLPHEESPLPKPPKYLALAEYGDQTELTSAVTKLSEYGPTAIYKMIKGFGKQTHDF